MTPDERIVVALVPAGGRAWAGVPVDVRLRRALKALGRAYGLKAVGVESEPAGAPTLIWDDGGRPHDGGAPHG